jgi:sugar O-acyltransferase (sialic acid O-acetyltransferase NeuD family)
MGPDRFLIWGGGGHGFVVADLIQALGHEVAGFADANIDAVKAWDGQADRFTEAKLFSHVRQFGRLPDGIDAIALGIGDNLVRLSRLPELAGLALPSLIHPTSWVSPTAHMGAGAIVLPLALVNNNARVGRAVIVNSGAIVEHDCDLADGVHISPGAVLSGCVTVGEGAWIGAGATVIPGVRIGAGAMVGAGSVVIRDVERETTVVGSPARTISRVR